MTRSWTSTAVGRVGKMMKIPQSGLKNESSFLYQPRVLVVTVGKQGWFKRLLRRTLNEPTQIVFPMDAAEVFISEQEATDFMPIFLNRLVKEKLLDPNKLFLKDNVLNEDYVKTAVVRLCITRLELDGGL